MLGDPVAHSRSPAMHNAAFAELGLDWRYEALRVEAERFAETVAALPGQGWAGANVTIPHKLRALELADSASEAARAIGAANTLTFSGGRIEAENTDAGGLLDALAGVDVEDLGGISVLLLGAGGSARAAAYALLRAGVRRLWLWNRTAARAAQLVTDLGAHLSTEVLELTEDPDAVLRSAGLIVNCTSVGLDPPTDEPQTLKELRISVDNLADQQTLVDLVYGPVETSLVRLARRRGVRCVDGLEILVCQGARSFELWTGRPAPRETMRKAARDGQEGEPGLDA